jgi:predicted murein hydrolase (TIGR00659 family)
MTLKLSELSGYLSSAPLLWLLATLLAYQAASAIYVRSKLNPIFNPVLVSVSFIISLLLLTGTPYQTYFDGVQLLHFMLGPATVALAIPLYAQIGRMRAMLLPMTLALLVGCMTAILSAVAIGWLFGASHETLLSLAPKSTTMPIAMAATLEIGGLASLTALTVTLTGVSGAIVARPLLNLIRIKDPAARGFAVGLTAHAIGTAHMLKEDGTAGAFSALAMGLNGAATAVLLPLIVKLAAMR